MSTEIYQDVKKVPEISIKVPENSNKSSQIGTKVWAAFCLLFCFFIEPWESDNRGTSRSQIELFNRQNSGCLLAIENLLISFKVSFYILF